MVPVKLSKLKVKPWRWWWAHASVRADARGQPWPVTRPPSAARQSRKQVQRLAAAVDLARTVNSPRVYRHSTGRNRLYLIRSLSPVRGTGLRLLTERAAGSTHPSSTGTRTNISLVWSVSARLGMSWMPRSTRMNSASADDVVLPRSLECEWLRSFSSKPQFLSELEDHWILKIRQLDYFIKRLDP
jgi:hypothetical protein